MLHQFKILFVPFFIIHVTIRMIKNDNPMIIKLRIETRKVRKCVADCFVDVHDEERISEQNEGRNCLPIVTSDSLTQVRITWDFIRPVKCRNCPQNTLVFSHGNTDSVCIVCRISPDSRDSVMPTIPFIPLGDVASVLIFENVDSLWVAIVVILGAKMDDHGGSDP